MAQRPGKKPILIVTCGNPDAGDDGLGHAVAEALRADPVPGVTVKELGIRPADLLDYVQGYAALIIVDAVSCPGEKPGKLMDVDWFDPARPFLRSEKTSSTHGISLGRQIDLGQALGILPLYVRVVGVNIARTEIGYPMTDAVEMRIPDVVRIIKDHATSRKRGQGEYDNPAKNGWLFLRHQ